MTVRTLRFRQLQLAIWLPVINKNLSRSLERSPNLLYLNRVIRVASKRLKKLHLTKKSAGGVLLKSPSSNPPNADSPTLQPFTTYPPTYRPLKHRLTDWLSSTYVKIDRIQIKFYFLKT